MALKGRTRLRIEGLNVAKLVDARGNPALMAALREAEVVHMDGAGISFGLKVLGIAPPERRAGIDLMAELCGLAAGLDRSVYLLGARPEIVRAAARRLAEIEPGLKVAGIRDGYFSEYEEQDIVEAIRGSGAGILFIGISSPKKEHFLQAHWQHLGVSVGMGVGGSFDVVSGRLRRAPVWMQRYGLEWLFRLGQEPGRLFRRYAFTNLCFLGLLIRARMSKSLPRGFGRHEN
ncbi:WecB/TagA/CpsF family glycosyltransferase [Methylomonas methanica]|nr:WecB/TagA/CpsF family glycosyltransferase [Methylomonas methanica]